MATTTDPNPPDQERPVQPTGPRNPKADAKAAKAYAKAERPWYKKKRWIFSLGLILLIVAISAGSSTENNDSNKATNDSTTTEQSSSSDTSEDTTSEEEEPEMTSGQENALKAAQNYLDFAPFSKKGLIQQLSSSAGDGYSRADATFAANNVDADWDKQAVKSARNYLEISPMSKDALIQQLSSSAGEDFTPAQARYAASEVY